MNPTETVLFPSGEGMNEHVVNNKNGDLTASGFALRHKLFAEVSCWTYSSIVFEMSGHMGHLKPEKIKIVGIHRYIRDICIHVIPVSERVTWARIFLAYNVRSCLFKSHITSHYMAPAQCKSDFKAACSILLKESVSIFWFDRFSLYLPQSTEKGISMNLFEFQTILYGNLWLGHLWYVSFHGSNTADRRHPKQPPEMMLKPVVNNEKNTPTSTRDHRISEPSTAYQHLFLYGIFLGTFDGKKRRYMGLLMDQVRWL